MEKINWYDNEFIINKWLSEKRAKGHKEITIETNRIFINQFLSKVKKPLVNITKDDLVKYFNELKKTGGYKGKGCKDGISLSYKRGLKSFYRWLVEEIPKSIIKENKWLEYAPIRNGRINCRLVDWFEMPSINLSEIKEEETLTDKEVNKMIDIADNFRDKCAISLLKETGARAQELLNVKIKDINLGSTDAIITIQNGKLKGGEPQTFREQLITDSFYHLVHHLRNHPDKDNKEAPLFFSNKRPQISYVGFYRVIEKYAKRVGIKKKCNPHWFRHSQISQMSKILSDAQLRVFAGHKAGSKMLGRYTHLRSKDTYAKIREAKGLQVPTPKKIIKPNFKPCRVCNKDIDINRFEFCGNCGASLNQKISMKANLELKRIQTMMEKMQLKQNRMYDEMYKGKKFDKEWKARVEHDESKAKLLSKTKKLKGGKRK